MLTRTNPAIYRVHSTLMGLFCLLCPSAKFLTTVLATVLVAVLTTRVSAEDFSSTDIEFFENEIRPLLVDHCLRCHGADEKKIRGGLRLTSRELMLKGGDSGAAILPGRPDDSLLISAVRHDDLEMPPKGKLTDEQIAKFERWVKLGAPDPRQESSSQVPREIDIESGRSFWSFVPRRPQKVPDQFSGDADWPQSPIDAFVLDKLQQAGLSPNPDVDRETLVRRAYLALIGLAPTQEQIDAFCGDERPLADALAVVVDELLASPHFGERWGRHWLDVARFSESSGGGRSLMFKEAWRFRDYVIQSYNADKPFDQFVREQIAGDLLPYDTVGQRQEQLVAAGFLVLGPINYEQQNKSLLRMEVVDEQVDTVGRAFLGMTLGCARCHDHKFDPIPTSDYYALAGIFQSTHSMVDGNVSNPFTRNLPLPPEEQARLDNYNAKLKTLSDQITQAEAKVKDLGGDQQGEDIRAKSVPLERLNGIAIDNGGAQLKGNWTSSTFVAKFVNDSYIHNENKPLGRLSAKYRPQFQTGGRYEVRMSYSAGGNRASNVPVTIVHQDGQDTVVVDQKQQPSIDGLFVSLGTFRFEADNVASVTIGTSDVDGVVIADCIQFLPEGTTESLAQSGSNGSTDDKVDDAKSKASAALQSARDGLKTLQEELADLKKTAPDPAPLAMSVEDVEEPADGHIHIRGSFDNLGGKVARGFLKVASEPDSSRPELSADASGRLELVDWIVGDDNPLTARVYVNRVWRHLFGRGLVATTDNFGAMGEPPSHPELLDYLSNSFVKDGWSTKRLIRRMMLSRVYWMSAESRDDADSIDDQNRLLWRANRRRLDAEVLRDVVLQVSGSLDLTAGGRTIRKLALYDMGYEFDTVRRSVYVPSFRNELLPFLEVFDVANPNLVIGNRTTTTLATQSLFMLNDPMVVNESRKLARRILDEDHPDDTSRIRNTYRRVLGRYPTKEELQLSADFLAKFTPDDPDVDDRLETWSGFCHGLFACLDFRYVD